MNLRDIARIAEVAEYVISPLPPPPTHSRHNRKVTISIWLLGCLHMTSDSYVSVGAISILHFPSVQYAAVVQ